jgi:hypothetical protein
MTFLSGWVAAAFAGIAIPALLLLYFLKLRRQERRVSSTLLWKKAVHDLQVNAPFQKLRKNLLLFLQLLILAAILFAIADPVINQLQTPDETVVILIDRSASMKTREEDGRSRLDHAKDAALAFIKDLGDDARAMVISFADRADIACSFTDDKRRLARQIEAIQPTDARTHVGEALQLAVAYSSQLIDEGRVDTPEAAKAGTTDIRLFSDGRIEDATQQAVIRGQLRYYPVGQAVDNVGIVSFDVRRDYERPGVLSIFAQVENFGPEPVTTDVSVSLDGKLLPGAGAIREVALGPASRAATQPGGSSRAVQQPAGQNVIFEFEHEAGGTIEVKLHREDALAVDNAVRAPIDPPREVRVLAVGDRDQVRGIIERAMEAIGVKQLDWKSSKEYETAGDDDLIIEGRSAYDLVVFDNHDTNRLPPGNYLFFGSVPKIEGMSTGEEIDNQYIIAWQENHPLIRPAEFGNIYVAKWRRLTLPQHASVLIEGEDSAVMAFIADPGHRYVVTAFDLLDSDFSFKIPFLIFLQNTTRYLTSAGLSETGRLAAPGDTLAVNVPAAAGSVRVLRPDGSTDNLDVAGRPVVTYAKTHDNGLYRFTFDDAESTTDVFAANTLSPTESAVAPRTDLSFAGTPVETVQGDVRSNESIWPWLSGLALLVLTLEWWVYNKRVMI